MPDETSEDTVDPTPDIPNPRPIAIGLVAGVAAALVVVPRIISMLGNTNQGFSASPGFADGPKPKRHFGGEGDSFLDQLINIKPVPDEKNNNV